MPTATAAFSGGLVVSALVGIPVGRWLDRIGPRAVMTVGSAIAVPAVVGIATARTFVVFLVAWLLAGVAMAGTLYPPAFAALTRWWGNRRVVALTGLTLAAGLTSTIFGPLTAALLGALGWRATYLVLALVLAVVTVPGHLWGLRGPWPAPDPPAHPAHADPGRAARSRPFVLLTVALTGGAFAVYAVLVGQVPLVIERGMSTTAAAWTLGLGGVGQVLGRMSYGVLERVAGVRLRTVGVLALCAATTAAARAPARPGGGAGRGGDARRRRARDLHVAAGHGRHRPLGHRVLRQAQRGALGAVDARDGDRAVGGRRAGRRARRLPRGVRAVGRGRAGGGRRGAGQCPWQTPHVSRVTLLTFSVRNVTLRTPGGELTARPPPTAPSPPSPGSRRSSRRRRSATNAA